jgi:hypothetical protein
LIYDNIVRNSVVRIEIVGGAIVRNNEIYNCNDTLEEGIIRNIGGPGAIIDSNRIHGAARQNGRREYTFVAAPMSVSSDMCPQPQPFYAAGDVNGSCVFNGIDITYFVGYLKGTQPALSYCPSCPPVQMVSPPKTSVKRPTQSD